MLLERGDRRFDLTHRMLVLGIVGDLATPEAWVVSGVDGLVVRSSPEIDAVCDRVDVPVGVVSRSGQVVFGDEVVASTVGPLDEREGARIGRLVAEIEAGRRAVLVTDPVTVGSDRRVAEVMTRLLQARSADSPERRT